MSTAKGRVPFQLLLEALLSTTAKLLWMAVRLHSRMISKGLLSPSRLSKRTGLSRQTVHTILTQLIATGRYRKSNGVYQGTTHPIRCRTFVYMPGDLLVDIDAEVQARFLYGVLDARKLYPQGRLSYPT